MVGGTRPLWAELRTMLGGETDFTPKQKGKRWESFFSLESRHGEELREEIVRMKKLLALRS